jgi:hypothetical protein
MSWNIASKVEPPDVRTGFVAQVKKQANQHEYAKAPMESKAPHQNGDTDDPSH